MTTDFEVRVEYGALPGRSIPSAWVHLADPASRTPVIWNSERLRSLNSAIDNIQAHNVEAILLLGNAHSFGVGADLAALAGARTVEAAIEIGAEGWRVFRRLIELETPSFALIAGFALGGGLELALFANYRLVRSDTQAIGLPEVRLGLVPGWGGIHRLARIAGPRVAYDVAVRDSRRGVSLVADDAARLGIVDEVIPTADWAESWPLVVVEMLTNHDLHSVRRRISDTDFVTELALVQRDAARARPSVSAAPSQALKLIEAAQFATLEEAEGTTTAVFAELLLSDAGKASLYAYQLSRSPDRLPAGLSANAGAPIKRAAVIGAGLMASQLATLLVRFGQLPVVLTDLNQERADRGADLVRANLSAAARAGEISEIEADHLRALISASAEPGAVAGADFLIEAIFENLGAKKEALADAEKYLSPSAVLATNTSSLSIEMIAEDLDHPERVIGFHVFNPVDSVPLVEIIRGKDTSDATISTVLRLAAGLRRKAIVSADAPGFVVNRLLARLFDVVLRAIDAGGDPATIDHSIDELGLPMTPLRLLDLIGPAVVLHLHDTLYEAFPDRFVRIDWLTQVIANGLETVLNRDGSLRPNAERLLPARIRVTGVAERAELAAATRKDILDALTDEVTRMLADGVVERAEDIDRAMILGANFPWALGGLTPYLRSRAAGEANKAP